MSKVDLRRKYLNNRNKYTEVQCAEMSLRITDLFLNCSEFPFSKISYLHLFLPIKDKREVDTSPIFSQVTNRFRNLRIVLSKADFNSYTMQHYVYDDSVKIIENEQGIPEPDKGNQIETDKIDLVIVPLLVVDKSGNRVGYGKGFYDRFLAECRQDCIKVGLSFEEPIDTIIPEKYDVPIDFCITPHKIHRFHKGKTL